MAESMRVIDHLASVTLLSAYRQRLGPHRRMPWSEFADDPAMFS